MLQLLETHLMKKTMRGRWLFFTLFSVLAMPGRFLAIFFRKHGLSDSKIGILLALSKTFSLLACAHVSAFADRIGERELVLAVSYGLTVLVFLTQAVAIPELNIVSNAGVFPLFIVTQIAFGVAQSGAYPLTSAITLSKLKEDYGHGGHTRFGEERLWGAVSWAVMSLLLGTLLDILPHFALIVHFGVAVFGIVFIITAIVFRLQKCQDQESVEKEAPSAERFVIDTKEVSESDSKVDISVMYTAKAILKGGGLSTVFFFFLVFTLTAGMSLVEGLLFLFFQKELKASNFVCGLSVVVTVVFEIPLFAMAPKLLKRLGAPLLIVIGAISFIIRGFGYTMVPNAGLVLLLEPLHGVTYAARTTAAVAYISERVPREIEATSQAVLGTLNRLASVLGMGIGGYIMEHFGSRALYQSGAIAVLCVTLAFAVVEKLTRKSHVGLVPLEDIEESTLSVQIDSDHREF